MMVPKGHIFSHDPNKKNIDCQGALETAIHKMAKQLLLEHRHAIFPELIIKETLKYSYSEYSDSQHVELEKNMSFDEISQEVILGDIRPDVMGYINNQPIIMEIAVTHFVDKEKRNKIRNLNIPAIEIDLSKVSRLPTKAELFKKVIKEVKFKKWIYNPREIEVREQLREKLKLHAKNEETKRQIRISQMPKIKKTEEVILPSPTPRQRSKDNTESRRWIRCESCHNLFHIATRNAPLGSLTIKCVDTLLKHKC